MKKIVVFLMMCIAGSVFFGSGCSTKGERVSSNGKTNMGATLKGRVIDFKSRFPISGAKVIPFEGEKASTLKDGTFKLKVPGNRAFTFRVQAPGYKETLVGGELRNIARQPVEIPLAKMSSSSSPIALIAGECPKVIKLPAINRNTEISKQGVETSLYGADLPAPPAAKPTPELLCKYNKTRKIPIAEGKWHQIALPWTNLTKLSGLTGTMILSFYDAADTRTWQYIVINADGTIASGAQWLDAAHGYFVLGTSPANLELVDGTENYLHSNYPLTLAGGEGDSTLQWNSVGCPYEKATPLTHFFIKKDKTSYSLSDAFSNNLSGPAVFYHFNDDSGTWEETHYPDGALEPFKGYYFLAGPNCVLNLNTLPPDPAADNLVNQAKTMLDQNDMAGFVALFEPKIQAEISSAVSKCTVEERRRTAQGLENAVFIWQSSDGSLRDYRFADIVDGEETQCQLGLRKDENGNWKISGI
jgi:hypothetical protein